MQMATSVPGLSRVSVAGCLELLVPVFRSFDGAHAADCGMVFDQAPHGGVAGLVGVISARDGFGIEAPDPGRKACGDTGGRDDDCDVGEFGDGEGGERIDGAFCQEYRPGRLSCDPEPALCFSGPGGHTLERAPGPGSVQFGAGRRSVSVAGDEDRICASIDVDQASPAAVIDQFRIEAALSGQISLHLLPMFRFRPWHGAGIFRRDLFQEVVARTERATGGMDREIDCTAAAD